MQISPKHGGWVPFTAVLWAALMGWPFVQAAWANGGPPQWAWMKGASTASQAGIYGLTGVPAAANTPGSRDMASSWTDGAGKLWLFGGYGHDSMGILADYLNDLWKYDPATGDWTWMKGSASRSQWGVYGTLGVQAAPNTPGARCGAVSWFDPAGALWLFGGLGYDGVGNGGQLSDLWKYDPVTGNWAWMSGVSTLNQLGIYGTLGVSAPGNIPGARYQGLSWTDGAGALWLFGGLGYDGTGLTGYLNDLWKYVPATGHWVWMKGANIINQSGTYGTPLTPAAANTPGARHAGAAWTDPSGALWLFGGGGYDSSGGFGYLNDLWKYTPATGDWAWMKGGAFTFKQGVYGQQGIPDPPNSPGARVQPAAWTDPYGALWLFGGHERDGGGTYGNLNDLWKYDRSTGSWVWVKGTAVQDQAGTHGTIGTPDAANAPGSRHLPRSWAGGAGALWLFGGYGHDSTGNPGWLNDLWRVDVRDTVPPTGSILVNNNLSVTNNRNVTLNLAWADGAGSGVVRMKFSNDGTIWTAWEPLAAAKSWTLPAGEGHKTVRAQFRDLAGNNSAVCNDYIRVDTLPPTGSILINGGAVSTKNRNVSLGLTWADGAGSGVVRMRFSIDGRTWTAWEALKATKGYTLPAAYGHHTVRVTYRDAGGNISTAYNDYIRLDP